MNMAQFPPLRTHSLRERDQNKKMTQDKRDTYTVQWLWRRKSFKYGSKPLKKKTLFS